MKSTREFAGRNRKGSAMAELGPALFLLFIFFFFPMLDLVALTTSYCCLFTLNDIQTREASMMTRLQAQSPEGIVVKAIPEQWVNNGIGRFVGVNKAPKTEVSYRSGGVADKHVFVATTATVTPLLTIPFFPGVPGLGAPIDFTCSSQRLVENQKIRF